MQRNRVCTPPASRECSTSPPSHSFAWSACAWTPPLSCAPAWSTSATTATTAATTTMWHDVDGAAERPLPPPIERRLGLDDDDDDTAPSWLLSSSHALHRSDTMPTLLLHTSSQQQRHDGDGSASEQLQTRTATACCVADVYRDGNDDDDDDEQVTPRMSCCRASTTASGTQGALQLCTPPPPSTRSSGSSAYTATRLTTTTMTMTGAAVTTTTTATTTTTTTPSCVRNAPLLYTPQVDPARIALRRQLDAEVDAANAQWRAAQQRQQQLLVSSLSLLHASPFTAASPHAPCRTAADAPPPPPPLSSSPVVVLDGLLYVGARPGVDVALSQLHALRVRHVVNCCAHDCPTTAAVRREFVVHERHAVDRDDYLILHHDYDAVARVVAAAAARGEAVYVHCVAGVNRSVALCVACLMDRRGIGPVEAVCALRRGRPLRLLENVGFRHQLVDHYLQGSAHGGHTNGAAAAAVIAL